MFGIKTLHNIKTSNTPTEGYSETISHELFKMK